MLSERTKKLLPSPTLLLDARAKELKEEGIDVINLTAGEPDFNTPQRIKTAAIKAINENFTHYTQTAGILELRKAISKKFLKDNKIPNEPQDIIVGTGSKQILYALFQVLLDKGDEVIVPVPTWTTYVEQIKLAGGKPVFIKLSTPFKLTFKDIKNKISSKTKAVIINSPANPTGAIIEIKEMKKIAGFLAKKNILIISDEIYEKVIYGKKHVSPASFSKKMRECTMTVNGVSKAYAMTGWRIGFATGPATIIEQMVNMQSQMTSSANSIAQKGAIAALNGSNKPIKQMTKEFLKRRDVIYKKLRGIKQLGVIKPEGAFYFFVSIEKLLGKKYKTSNAWCEALLEKEKVAVVPGEAFLYPGYFRLSFATSLDLLEEATKRIERFIENE